MTTQLFKCTSLRLLTDAVLTFFTEMSRKTWSSTAIECVPPQTSPENYKISAAAE